MMRWFMPIVLVAALCCTDGKTMASDAPVLEVDLNKDSVIPGQPIVLRVTVLVPTWLPKPPDFPSFEVPNVMVRLPSRASGPTSKRVGKDTWSGVTRAYRLYPMIAGQFRIPPLTVGVTFADPETRDPITAELKTPEIVFSGKAPAGSEDLDPFVAANSIKLEQTIEGDPAKLDVGGAVTRTVSAQINGAAPIFLPSIIPEIQADGLGVYPDEPRITESENRGVLSGKRIESVVIVAERGGRYSVEPIQLDWYNLKTGEVERAQVPGFDIIVMGPIAEPVRNRDWQRAVIMLIGVLVLLGILAIFWRRLAPVLERRTSDLVRLWHASEVHAYRQATKKLRRRDFPAALTAVDVWRRKKKISAPEDSVRLDAALVTIGQDLYGSEPVKPGAQHWREATEALAAERRSSQERRKLSTRADALPPLNPGHARP